MAKNMITKILVSALVFSAAPAQAQGYNQGTQSDGQAAGSSAQSYLPQDSRPAYGDNGYNVGSHGYNGSTGQVDRRYVPAGSNPNPPANVYR